MSDRRDDILDTLSESMRLVGDMELPSDEEFSLNSILSEFGQGAAEPAPKTEETEETEKAVDTTEEAVDEIPAEEEPMTETEEDSAPEEVTASAPRRGKVLQFPKMFARGGETEAPVEQEEEIPEKTVETPPRAKSPSAWVEPPETVEDRLPLEEVMARTVNAVLEDDAVLEEREPLKDQLGFLWANLVEKASELLEKLPVGESSGAGQAEGRRQPPPPPEPDMEQASRESLRRCKRLRRQLLLAVLPLLPLLAVTVIHTWWGQLLPSLWRDLPLVRCCVAGGLLLLTCLLCMGVWREAWKKLQQRSVGCEVAAALCVLAVLGDCAYGAITAEADLPLAATAALLVWLCQLGLLLISSARREAFRLAEVGGRPPYAAAVTASGICKQQGSLEGFYHTFGRSDLAQKSQMVLLPLLLSAATVLTGVVCIGGDRMEDFLRTWSAMLMASLPLGLPLCGSLSVYFMNRRIGRSGCAVAGYAGAKAISKSKRMVVTDSDLFPPGTVSLNGLKIYGEEIGKVVSYAATVAKAADSPLRPIFEQMLASEGGTHCPCDDLHFYEEGGAGVTIAGESVIMGSEFFMKKQRVTLPRELKVKTGVFLAVDGQLIAIFAIKYQAARNVEWALRALRRSRMEPVMAVRGENVTPSLVKRSFGVNVKPIYPDISNRLALTDLTREPVLSADAILYREGLMPFAETVIGSRRCCRMVRWSVLLCWLASLCGLLLAYYLTGVAAYSAMSAGYMLVFSLLWLLPTMLLGDLTRRY